MKKNFFDEEICEQEIGLIPPLVLAYIGDAVYEVYIRQYAIHHCKKNVNDLHKMSTKFVQAKAQAKIVHVLEEELSEEEWIMVKKGRNQKSSSVPKNACLTDYKYATGFETLIGYLYLSKNINRLEEVIQRGIEIIEESL
ncbi:Mini-ribonuclease 3 [Inediibacterium massiliense]|uniref:Mini-ribonuclease 3 n=1 Tax=Inediibacterium massiliense TaxID=1658111 RepID=UPI0006B46165|nr:ribonuclease III domain-containing protein [Inediibacterium massiliense]